MSGLSRAAFRALSSTQTATAGHISADFRHSSFLRPCNVAAAAAGVYRNISTSQVQQAPKAKGGAKKPDAGAGAEKTGPPGANHIFNIFAEKQDPKVLPDEFYPKWLWHLALPVETYGELALKFVYGQGIETADLRQYRRFRRMHNRYLIKLNNMRTKKAKRRTVASVFQDA
eukprot:GDKI01020900.1.p1 GENE.GDKI01020900.1~~GDKI01020900.1.p1  ORF type:complete len:172 (-),score=21.34 GDKI01020900.1:763-1278(-)